MSAKTQKIGGPQTLQTSPAFWYCVACHINIFWNLKNVNASCSGRCCTPSQHGWSLFPAVSATVPAGTPSHLSQWQPLPVFHPNVSCGFFPFQITIFPGKKNPSHPSAAHSKCTRRQWRTQDLRMGDRVAVSAERVGFGEGSSLPSSVVDAVKKILTWQWGSIEPP